MKLNKRRLLALGLFGALAGLFSLSVFAQGNSGNARGGARGRQPARTNVERQAPGPPAGVIRGRPADIDQGPPAGIVRGRANAANGTTLVGSDNRYRALAKRLGRSPESIRDWYYAELGANPRLNYGLFVAANNVALRSGFPVGNILAGLRGGESLGQVKQRLGISGEDNENEIEREIEDELEAEGERPGNVRNRNNNRTNPRQPARPVPGRRP